jgi:hypothetical protein
MGEFYAKQIGKLIRQPSMVYAATSLDTAADIARREKRLAREARDYADRLLRNREHVIGLIIELLWYQKW